MFTSTPFPRGEGESGTIGLSVRQSVGRGRQSFAYPPQQVFEETRSMLLNDEDDGVSEFEMTLKRSRLTLVPEGPEDFVGAMDALHEQFGVVIDCMTDRSQIFEVISKWMENIDLAAQHQRTNETEISEANFRKVQNLLRLENETWKLIYTLYFTRLNEDEGSSDQFKDVIRDRFCVNEEPYVEKIVNSDFGLKEMFYILGWLEGNFMKFGPPDLSEKFFIWENTLESLKRDKMLNKPSSRSTVSRVDPDAPTREGKQLHPLDQEETTKMLKGAFYYIRTGQLEEAIAYLGKSGERVKAAALTGYQFTAKTEKDSETGEAYTRMQALLPSMEYLPKSERQARPNPDFSIRGNPNRALWKLMSWKVCEKNKMLKYDRALVGSVCGHRNSMLDVANTWEDRLWAFLKASVDAEIELKLRSLSKPDERKRLPDSFWSQRLSVPACIAKVEAFSNQDSVNFPESFFQILQKRVMVDKISDFIKDLETTLPDFFEAFDHPTLVSHFVRFLTHFLLFLGVVELPHSQLLIDMCVERYISVLVDTNLLTRTPYYIQKLSDDKKIPAFIRHISSERQLTKEEVVEFLQRAQTNDLDILAMAVAVVDKMRSEEDDFSVEHLDWISCCYEISENPPQVMYELLKYSIWITRQYLTLGNLDKVQKLMGQITPETLSEVGQLSDSYENNLVREYLCYKVYLEAEDALSLWKKALSQKPYMDIGELPVNATKSDRTIFEKRQRDQEALDTKWRRAVDFHLKGAIEKFMDILKFPLGWLRECYDPTDKDESLRIGAVRRIIIKKVVHILLRLIQDKNDNRTTRDFLYVISDDSRNILYELSSTEVANLSKKIETFTRQKVSNIMFLPK